MMLSVFRGVRCHRVFRIEPRSTGNMHLFKRQELGHIFVQRRLARRCWFHAGCAAGALPTFDNRCGKLSAASDRRSHEAVASAILVNGTDAAQIESESVVWQPVIMTAQPSSMRVRKRYLGLSTITRASH